MYKETQRGSDQLFYTKRAFFSYSPFSHTSCMHLVYPQFLLGITLLVPREIKDNSYAKFWEVNKVRAWSI